MYIIYTLMRSRVSITGREFLFPLLLAAKLLDHPLVTARISNLLFDTVNVFSAPREI